MLQTEYENIVVVNWCLDSIPNSLWIHDSTTKYKRDNMIKRVHGMITDISCESQAHKHPLWNKDLGSHRVYLQDDHPLSLYFSG